MSYEFADATPVKTTGGGRTAAPNPFLEVVAAIAAKKNKDGTPVAKAFIENHEKDARNTHVNRIKGQMSAAGLKATPPVTVRVNAEAVTVKGKDVETQTRITFWTLDERQKRPRKEKVVEGTATASTEQSTAPASA
jgi:hypothetical protein